MKFGGISFETPQCFEKIADIVEARSKQYDQLLLVVSAMRGQTQALIDLAQSVNPQAPQREYDMLIAVGERISSSLLAMALHKKGLKATSYTGSQAGIITSSQHSNASILEVSPQRLLNSLGQGEIPIVAGFQGVSREKNITTLGRGGSDTSAVALALAMGASHVEFFKDVEGIYEEDPKLQPEQEPYPLLSYERALEIVQKGHAVLHPRSLLMAQNNFLPLHIWNVKAFAKRNAPGTVIRSSEELAVRATPIYETSRES